MPQPGSNQQSQTRRIPTLDGWRGVAIILVLIDHTAESIHQQLIHKVTRVGATGVGIFFALSGFLITTRLISEQRRSGKLDFRRFYVRRAFRLLPPTSVYLVALSVLTAVGLIAVTKEQLLGSLFFYRNYLPSSQETSGWFTAHFWSLNVEEHFYLLWPAMLVMTRRKLAIPIGFAVSVAVWRFLDIRYHIVHANLWLPGRTDVRLDSLLWGCILAIMVSEPKMKEWLSRYLTGKRVLVLAVVDVIANAIHGKHDYSPYEPLFIALIVVWPVLNPTGAFGKFLEWDSLKWLGTVSYSVYIWQQLWLLFPGDPIPFGRFQLFPLNLLCLFGTATISYYCLEKPMIALGHSLTTAKETPVAIAG
jgi:peptidoglycan/LPS O-acetylase OafA/YrhL